MDKNRKDYIVIGIFDGWIRFFLFNKEEDEHTALNGIRPLRSGEYFLKRVCKYSPSSEKTRDRLRAIKKKTFQKNNENESNIRLNGIDSHKKRINSIAIRGKQIVSCSFDKTIKFWDISTLKLQSTLMERRIGPTNCLLFYDDNTLISGNDDANIYVWDLKTKKVIHEMKGHKLYVYSLVIVKENIMASSSDDKTIRIWNLKEFKCIRTIKGHQNGVFTLKVSPLTNNLFSCSFDMTIREWDVDTGKCLRVFDKHNGPIRSFDFLNGGKSIVSGGNDGIVHIHDIETGNIIQKLHGHEDKIHCIKVIKNGKYFMSGSYDRSVIVWNLKGEVVKKCILKKKKGGIRCLDFLENVKIEKFLTKFGNK